MFTWPDLAGNVVRQLIASTWRKSCMEGGNATNPINGQFVRPFKSAIDGPDVLGYWARRTYVDSHRKVVAKYQCHEVSNRECYLVHLMAASSPEPATAAYHFAARSLGRSRPWLAPVSGQLQTITPTSVGCPATVPRLGPVTSGTCGSAAIRAFPVARSGTGARTPLTRTFA
jgi:hypothetical protein